MKYWLLAALAAILLSAAPALAQLRGPDQRPGHSARLVGTLLTSSSTNGNVFGLSFDFVGAPASSQIVAQTLVFTATVGNNMTGSACTVGTATVEDDTYTVKVAGSTVGEVCVPTSCSASSCAAVFCSGASCSCNSSCVCTGGSGVGFVINPQQGVEMDAPTTVSGRDVRCTVAYMR